MVIGSDSMNQRKYTIFIEKIEEDGYAVTVPSLPGCIREGNIWDEAIAHITDAI